MDDEQLIATCKVCGHVLDETFVRRAPMTYDEVTVDPIFDLSSLNRARVEEEFGCSALDALHLETIQEMLALLQDDDEEVQGSAQHFRPAFTISELEASCEGDGT